MQAVFPFPTEFLAVLGPESNCLALSHMPASTRALVKAVTFFSFLLPSLVKSYYIARFYYSVFAPVCYQRVPSWNFLPEGRWFLHPQILMLIAGFLIYVACLFFTKDYYCSPTSYRQPPTAEQTLACLLICCLCYWQPPPFGDECRALNVMLNFNFF